MATTPKGYPYPIGTDRVVDGDNAIQALATAVDTILGLSACGVVSIPITAPGVNASVTVTFPVGRFTAPPQVQATHNNVSTTNARQPTVNAGATATSCVISGSRDSGSAPFPVSWWAVQL
jgi:hypothetical protein